MKNISHKIKTHRTAIAGAIVRVSKKSTIDAIINKTLKNGDVFETARIAGLLAVKRTSDLIPDCHHLPIEYASVSLTINELDIIIESEVQAIAKTGPVMEAINGATIAAMTVYERLRSVDENMEITGIRLLKKKGGTAQYADFPGHSITTAVIVCSDSIAAGKKEDYSGKAIISKLEKYNVVINEYSIIPDEVKNNSAKN